MGMIENLMNQTETRAKIKKIIITELMSDDDFLTALTSLIRSKAKELKELE